MEYFRPMNSQHPNNNNISDDDGSHVDMVLRVAEAAAAEE